MSSAKETATIWACVTPAVVDITSATETDPVTGSLTELMELIA